MEKDARERKNKAKKRKKRKMLEITSEEKERQRAPDWERVVAYRKRKKEALHQSHVNLAAVDVGTSATLPLQSVQKPDLYAAHENLYPSPAL